MMMKNCLFAVALVSAALLAGCATGGGGHPGDKIQVSVNTNPPNQSVVGVTLTIQFTATVTGTSTTAVTWSLSQSGGTCTGTPNPCGTIDANGLYTAPSTPPATPTVNVTATSQANSTKSNTYAMKVLPITVTVTPGPAIVGVGFQQQFTATVTPDAAPQTVTWTIPDCPANDCGSVGQNTGLYTAPGGLPVEKSFSVQATSSIDPPNSIGTSKVTMVQSRLSGTYAFRFSGFDSLNQPIAVAGNFVANSSGAITSGVEDELTASGHANRAILGTSGYALDGNDHGSITLKTGAGPHTYKVVLNASGDGQMIEFDSNARGSGKIALATTSAFNDGALFGSFAFGLTGVDILTGKRAGSAGVFQADGAGNINLPPATPGQLDINDGGVPTSSNNVTGTYSINPNGSGTMTLTDKNTGTPYQFAVYVVGGKTQNAANPLTLYAISTDPLANPAVVGDIVFQDPTPTYDKSALNNFSVSNLTGVDTGSNTLVSLTTATGDGNGNFTGSYDANNAGTIVAAKSFTSTYAASGNGRYTVDLLSPAVHFVLYLSAANRGFLLDQSSQAVYTGTMDQQPGSNFAFAELAGSLEAATGSSGTSGVSQVAMNLLLTSVVPNFTVAGKQDETDGGQNAGQTLAGTYTVKVDGTGTIKLTQPPNTNYVIYVLDNPKQSGNMIQHFVMISVDPANTNPSIIFGER